MKKILFLSALLCLASGTSMAHDVTGRIGLGFVSRDTDDLRYMFSPRIGGGII
jgi:hypothetical protein